MADGLAERIVRLQRQIADEKANIRRMITRGGASQQAEDKLRRLEADLARLAHRLNLSTT
jgi:hypothetical protein